VELAKQSVAVLRSQFRQVSNERLDLLAGGLPDVLGAAELGGVLLHQGSIQTVLSDQQAELVAELGLPVAINRLRWKFPHILFEVTASGQGTDFLDRANADSVSLCGRTSQAAEHFEDRGGNRLGSTRRNRAELPH